MRKPVVLLFACLVLVACIGQSSPPDEDTSSSSSRTSLSTTTTDRPGTTTTTATTTTAVVTTTEAPPPPPTEPPPPPPPPTAPYTLKDKIHDMYSASVPGHWRSRINPEFKLRPGSTSYSHPTGLIEISEYHANSSRSYLGAIIAHEFGHLIAFRYGTQAYLGAPPEGWPPRTDRPEEHWADCVQTVFTGNNKPVPGLPPCEGEQLSWAANYLSN